MDEDDVQRFEAGMEFLAAAQRGAASKLARLSESGADANFVHPITGNAALHDIARSGSRRLFKAFLRADDIDFLKTDRDGRLASSICSAFNNDAVMARFLRLKERRQAEASGLDYAELAKT
ncbi:MAG: hypothetical protein AAF192_10335 [Pseudomonadota bacterium]